LSAPDLSVPTWGQAIGLYFDKRLWLIFGLGLASGFPWVMIGSAMSAWLAEEGLSRSNIGFFGFIFVAYSINFLWSPLLDRFSVPLIGRFFGQRRSWIILMQVLIALCCWFIASVNPSLDLAYAKTIAFALALVSATQDIAIDAFRIDSLPANDSRLMAAGSAMATAGWWSGFAGLGAIPLLLVDFDAWAWKDVYYLMSVLMLGLIIVPLLASEPETERKALQAKSGEKYRALIAGSEQNSYTLFGVVMVLVLILLAWFMTGLPGIPNDFLSAGNTLVLGLIAVLIMFIVYTLVGIERNIHSKFPSPELQSPLSFAQKLVVWLMVSFIEPLAEFFRRNGVQLALSVLLFIFLFKIGEAFLGRMSIVFYKEVGFSNTDIALYSKLVSWWVTIVFSLIGSLVTIRYGILKGLFVGGLAMGASNLMFALLASVGPDKLLLVSAVVVDGFTSAWSTVAFVAFLSMMCSRAFTASQYALMASLGTLGRTLLASYSGVLVDFLEGDWSVFFVITSLMVLPSLWLLYLIRHRLRSLAAEF